MFIRESKTRTVGNTNEELLGTSLDEMKKHVKRGAGILIKFVDIL